MTCRDILFFIVAATILTACASTPPHLDLVPMYGHPEVERSSEQKKADEAFIKSVTATLGSREKAGVAYYKWGTEHRDKGETADAMRRFNQSWLLNPDSYLPYWGFGDLLLAQGKAAEAEKHYEKALALVGAAGAKPKLLVAASGAYTARGNAEVDKVKAGRFFEKANSLLNEAVTLDQKNGYAYKTWAKSLYLEGHYKEAWDMVKKSRGLEGGEISPGFLEKLARQMPEPE
ncbi:MAG: hypothetical protein HY938_02580 [Nitrosomonadales bacterium]|nr:hypothetical protein [Nitrosomonadales bacterium]